ncbi:MAG: hypothetical protein ACD_19C00021G0017 [uncultured bacterium]|nr:MAG: hypothetical protein ACD_19C00021G0017 [uncultured bacterium]
MQTLILPGISKEDKSWVDEVAKSIKSDDIVRPFYWMHWTDENFKFNPQEKTDLIVKHLKGEKANIIAKDEGLEIANLIKSQIPDQIISIN